MINFMWNARQQREIANVQYHAAKAKQDSGRSAERIRDLEFSVERATLIAQALWELLRERLGTSDADLLAKMEEISARSEVQDCDAPSQPAPCANCARPLGTNAVRCLYCGTSVPKSTIFG